MSTYDDLLIELGGLTKALNRHLADEFPDEELIDSIEKRIAEVNEELDDYDQDNRNLGDDEPDVDEAQEWHDFDPDC